MDAKFSRNANHQQGWLRACILGMALWACALIGGDHLPASTAAPIKLGQVAIALVGAALWTGAGWRTIVFLRRSNLPALPYGKAAVFTLGTEAVLQEIWIVLLLFAPEFSSARVVAETNLLVGCTAMLAGVVYWSAPARE